MHVRQSLRLCQELLAGRGKILIVFPEGTRGNGQTVDAFKPGVGTLLAGTSTPAVPCVIDGAADALPKGAWLPMPRRITLTLGKPLVFADRQADKQSAMEVSAELRQAVMDLQAMDGAVHRRYGAREREIPRGGATPVLDANCDSGPAGTGVVL